VGEQVLLLFHHLSLMIFTLKCAIRFAYVDFGTTEAKQAAIALSEQPLLGRKLLIKDGMQLRHGCFHILKS
jgi:hypothetical protein